MRYLFLFLLLCTGCSSYQSKPISVLDDYKIRGPASSKETNGKYLDIMKECHRQFPCRIDLPNNSVFISGNLDVSGGINTFTVDSQLPLIALVSMTDPMRFTSAGKEKLKAIFNPIRNSLKFYNQVESENILKIDGTQYSEGSLVGIWVMSSN